MSLKVPSRPQKTIPPYFNKKGISFVFCFTLGQVVLKYIGYLKALLCQGTASIQARQALSPPKELSIRERKNPTFFTFIFKDKIGEGLLSEMQFDWKHITEYHIRQTFYYFKCYKIYISLQP